MKRCEDCKWDKISREGWTARGLYACYLCVNCGSTKYYWAAKVVIITLALLLGGCVHVKQDDFEYWRFGSQQIGSALLTLPDGSELLLDGQKSELPKVEITATSITIGKLKP